jgi:hypothetical protein
MEHTDTHSNETSQPEDTKQAGDSVIILSSDLIASVMEDYFNDHMFKVGVDVIDLQPTPSGYAFTLAFSHHQPTVDQAVNDLVTRCTYCDGIRSGLYPPSSTGTCPRCHTVHNTASYRETVLDDRSTASPFRAQESEVGTHHFRGTASGPQDHDHGGVIDHGGTLSHPATSRRSPQDNGIFIFSPAPLTVPHDALQQGTDTGNGEMTYVKAHYHQGNYVKAHTRKKRIGPRQQERQQKRNAAAQDAYDANIDKRVAAILEKTIHVRKADNHYLNGRRRLQVQDMPGLKTPTLNDPLIQEETLIQEEIE